MQTLEQELLERGLVPAERLERAAALARDARRSLPAVLLDEGWIAEPDLLEVLAPRYALSVVRLDDTAIEPAAVKAVPAKLAAHYGVMPVRLAGGSLTLAVADPLDLAAVEDIETNLGLHVERVLACREDIRAALRTHYGVGAETVQRILAGTPDRVEVEGEVSHDLERMAEDASVVRLVNQLIQDAIRDRATDIHFEMHRDGVKARRRIDGILYDTSLPRDIRVLYPSIVSRVKLMSHLNIVERRLPQDGRARVSVKGAHYDLRVSVVPAIHGEDIVIRILPSTMLFDLGRLGFADDHRAMLEELIARPHGIVFVTGPTGSGKSTTLYACLSRLNTAERKIITIEDPVEYELRGITQTQIRPEIGLTFARALRSMLRHDPDVMMVGEVRDRETAEIAIQTAMTGHLVLSTLHTNDAASAAVRLIDMGIDPYLITSTVLAFTAQRLVRVICPDCKERVEGSAGFQPAPQSAVPRFRGKGCPKCHGRGYRGRVAIAEFVPLTDAIQTRILARASAMDIRREADTAGFATLAEDGRRKVAAGITTEEEVLRVTSL
jgi:general secretion pathway protein E